MLQSPSSIETKDSWVVASVALFIMMMAFGAAWMTAVALKDIAGEAGGARSIPALANALAWLGSGGILMGRIADRVGTRWTVMFGSLMIGLGLSISTLGPSWPPWIGHGLFIGLIGLGGINASLRGCFENSKGFSPRAFHIILTRIHVRISIALLAEGAKMFAPRFNKILLWAATLLSLTPAFAAQKSSEKLASRPRSSYSLIKQLAKEDLSQAFGASKLRTMLVHATDDNYDLRADFDECGSNEFFISGSWNKYGDKPVLYLLTNLAIDVARWQKDLKTIGYPEPVFQPAVSEFEEKILSRIDKLSKSELDSIYKGPVISAGPNQNHEDIFGPFEKTYRQDARALASKLNDYRKQKNTKIPKISVGGDECGAGGLTVKIITNPPGGSISIIPIFFYKLCRAQNLNADDPDSCDRWRDIHDGFNADVSGDYRYKARWQDGATREGTLPFSTMDGQKTLLIRKP
jgi:hypothetical protein